MHHPIPNAIPRLQILELGHSAGHTHGPIRHRQLQVYGLETPRADPAGRRRAGGAAFQLSQSGFQTSGAVAAVPDLFYAKAATRRERGTFFVTLAIWGKFSRRHLLRIPPSLIPQTRNRHFHPFFSLCSHYFYPRAYIYILFLQAELRISSPPNAAARTGIMTGMLGGISQSFARRGYSQVIALWGGRCWR